MTRAARSYFGEGGRQAEKTQLTGAQIAGRGQRFETLRRAPALSGPGDAKLLLSLSLISLSTSLSLSLSLSDPPGPLLSRQSSRYLWNQTSRSVPVHLTHISVISA